MLRVTIPLALFVAVGLASRLTSQEATSGAPAPAGISAGPSSPVTITSSAGTVLEATAIELQVEQRRDAANPPDGRPGAAANADSRIVVFPLKHATAESAAVSIERLFGGADVIVVSDDRTNQLILRGAGPVLEEIKALVLRLDEPKGESAGGASTSIGPAIKAQSSDALSGSAKVENAPRAPGDVLFSKSEEGASVVVPLPPGHPFPPGPPGLLPPGGFAVKPYGPPEFVPHQYGQHDVFVYRHAEGPGPHGRFFVGWDSVGQRDHELAVLAERIRTLRQESKTDDGVVTELESALRDLVTKEFDARQQAQRAELSVLEQQLTSIQQAIEARDREKDQIVKQRVEDWLSGKAGEGKRAELGILPVPATNPLHPATVPGPGAGIAVPAPPAVAAPATAPKPTPAP